MKNLAPIDGISKLTKLFSAKRMQQIVSNLIITALSIGILLWGTTAPAAEKLLTDAQLDRITAGSVGDSSPLAFSADNMQLDSNASTANHVDSSSSQGDLGIDNSTDNSQNINSGNEIVVLQDNAQENARALNIINGSETRPAIGINIHTSGFGSASGSQPGSSSLNNLYQVNILQTQ